MRSYITPENSTDYIGKTVKWFSHSAEENPDCHGIATIESIDFEKKRPISATIKEGDNLNLAIVGVWGEFVAYSDMDRPVLVEIIEKEEC